MRPTVVTGLSDSTRCMQEEIFGQCISLMTLKSKAIVRYRFIPSHFAKKRFEPSRKGNESFLRAKQRVPGKTLFVPSAAKLAIGLLH